MAINTAARRFSMMGFGNPCVKLAPPSGSVDEDQQYALNSLYPITSDAPFSSGLPLYDVSTMTYLGAFRINDSDAFDSRGRIGFSPPNGSNGTFGSLFVQGKNLSGEASIGEFEIPATLGSTLITDQMSLPSATNLQAITRLTLTAAGAPAQTQDRMGMMRVVNGKLFVGALNTYDADTINPSSMTVFDDPNDILTGANSGWVGVDVEDFANIYMEPVPSEWQATLGGEWLSGSGAGFSISARYSNGPAIYTSDPQDWVSGVSTELSTTAVMSYDSGHRLGRGLYGMPTEGWTDQLSGSETDTYNQSTVTHYLDQILGGPDERKLGSSGWGLKVYEDWHVGGQTPAWSTLTPPAAAIQNDLWLSMCAVGTGFIVPNTRTFLALGSMSGATYGGGYKPNYWDQTYSEGTRPTGEAPLSYTDRDNYYWAYDLDKVVNNSNIYDPIPVEYGVFQSNRWYQDDASYSSGVGGHIGGGCYDPDTDRLYVSHRSVRGTGGLGRIVVAVYDVNSPAGSDVDAPIFDAGPTVSSTNETGHDFTFTLDEGCTVYAVRLDDGDTAPTATQIEAGTDAADVAAPEAKNVVVTSGVQGSFSFVTASASTAYDYYFTAVDSSGNKTTPILVGSTTAATGGASEGFFKDVLSSFFSDVNSNIME